MVKFASDENLGKVIDMKQTKVWSFGIDPIKSIDDLRFAAGGNKFSQLCGFKFVSKNPILKDPRFSISFVCKLHSFIYKPDRFSRSQWFIFKNIDFTRNDVLDKKACFVNYGFDVDKFFDSDLFAMFLPQFKKMIKIGLTRRFLLFIDLNLLLPEVKKEAQRYASAIENSLEYIGNKQVNNKYWSLTNSFAAETEIPNESELDEKIEQELKKRGIYADLNTEVEA